MSKLDHKEKHLMRLILEGVGGNGWTPVSDAVWPLVKDLPFELVETMKNEKGKFAKLTHDGNVILNWV